jgi:hypothetical protein
MTKIPIRHQKDYSKRTLVFTNLLLVIWIILGSLSIGFIHPIIGWIYLFSVSFIIFWVLRKHCCKTCYYCKGCTIGFGKLPELFLKKNGTENVDRTGLKFFGVVYLILGLLPIIVLIGSLFNQFSIYKLALLLLLLNYSLVSGIVRKKIIKNFFHS